VVDELTPGHGAELIRRVGMSTTMTGGRLAGGACLGTEEIALSRRKQWFESHRERRNISYLSRIPKTTFRHDQTSTKD
jgi:hypothetical protein